MAELDKCLPKWIDAAMQGEHACLRTFQPVQTASTLSQCYLKHQLGEYPWVMPVKVVCGGDSQALSQVVRKWVKANKHVANAPART